MFESQNFFKSINCPYYSQSTNSLNCERAYCPFKHPNQQQLNLQQKEPLALIEPKQVDLKNGLTQTTVIEALALPNALETLSNALQTFQDLIKQNKSSTSTGIPSSSADNNLSSTIVNQLNNLSNVISAVSNTTSSTQNLQKKSSSSSSLKRNHSVPDYNPTPINELKKLKHESPSDDKPSDVAINSQLKRKDLQKSEESLESWKYETTTEQSPPSSNQGLTKKFKTETNLSESSHQKLSRTTSGSSINSANLSKPVEEPKPKCDLVTFSKLSLSQQVLKRYEMLNKAPPTQASTGKANLNKKPTTTPTTSTQDPNLPHLILDTATNSNFRVPLGIRQQYLKVIFDNCKPLYQPIQRTCEKASEYEKSVYDRSKNKQIYNNLVAILIKSLRTEQVQLQNEMGLNNNSNNNNKKTAASSPISSSSVSSASSSLVNLARQNSMQKPQQPVQTYSHEALLSGPRATRVSYSINRVKQLEFKDLSVTQLYQMFYEYVLDEKQLEDNSFPKWVDSDPDETPTTSSSSKQTRLAYIPNFTQPQSKNSTEKFFKTITELDSKLLTKTCKRCQRNFYLYSRDLTYYSENSECVYHWGKLRSVRVNKAVEQKYPCCSGGPNSTGCEEGKHVYDGDYDGHGNGTNLTDYVETQEASTAFDLLNSKSAKNVYALDCEMCYTTKGLEVTRVSIVDIHCKPVYESLVKPDAQILDYNTRWSGLTESILRTCNKKLKQVHAELLRIINKDTILIGHSLDSDFKALKLIHKNVIDTSVVFPHKMGPPYKRALRNLMSEHLQRIIQEDSDGHDSKEDATSCVQLMIWKINEDLKSKKQPSFLSNQSSFKLNNVQGNGLEKTQVNKSQQQASNMLLSQVKAKIAESQKQAYTANSSLKINLKQ